VFIKKTSLKKMVFGQFHYSKARSHIDISVYVHAGTYGMSMAVVVLFSEQYFLLRFLSFSRKIFLFGKHSLEIISLALQYAFILKHFTMSKLMN